MAWNEQSTSEAAGPVGSGSFGTPEGATPANMPIPMNGQPEFAPPMMQPTNEYAPESMSRQPMPNEQYLPGAVGTNPLLQQAAPPISQQAMAVGTGMAGPLPAAGQVSDVNQDDETTVDDVVWVNRTKKIIATTRNDPHRRVQLLQQLSVVYLKEKYGRSVHADEV